MTAKSYLEEVVAPAFRERLGYDWILDGSQCALSWNEGVIEFGKGVFGYTFATVDRLLCLILIQLKMYEGSLSSESGHGLLIYFLRMLRR